MKKLAGLIIILAVLILGGYYGMGVVTEKTIKKNIAVINQTNGLFADITQYKRGWFCSKASIQWRVHVPERVVKGADGASQTVAAQDVNMDMPVTIYHGPFIYANHQPRFGMGYAETVFPFPEQFNAQFDAMFSKDSVKPHADLSIFVNYFNKSTLELAFPSFKLISKDGKGTLDWMGMESTTSISSNLDKVEGGLVIKGLNIAKEDTKVTLGKVTSEYDLHKTHSGLYLGEAKFSLPAFSVLVKDKPMLELNDFSISTSSDIQDALFSTNLHIALHSLVVNGKSYGPGALAFSLRNLDADVLAKINEQANAAKNGPDAARQQSMLALLPELPKLVSKGAEFEISTFNLKVPEGVIDGHLVISLPKGDNANPFELIQKIKGDASLKAPIAVVQLMMQQSLMQQMAAHPEMQAALMQQAQPAQTSDATQASITPEQLATMQAQKQIAAIEKSGLVRTSGSDYVIDMHLDQGKFTINDKPFDPSMVQF